MASASGDRAGSPLKRLVAQGGIYTVARVASQALGFLLLPLYTRALGSEGFGVIEVANAARNVLMIVMLQGLHGAWFRLRYDFSDPSSLRRFETSVVWYLTFSNIAWVAVASAVGPGVWNALVPGVPYFPFGLLTLVAAACAGLGTLVERKLQAEQRAWAFAGYTLSRTAGTLCCIVIAVAVLGRGARGKFEAEAITGIIGAGAAWVLLRPGPPREISRSDLKRALAFGWPIVPHGLAGLANDMIDRFMVNAMLGVGAAGVYSLGYRVGSIAMIAMLSINQALAPLFTEGMLAVDREPDPERARVLGQKVAQLCLFVIGLGVLAVQGVTAFAPEAIALVGTAEFASSTKVVAPVAAGVLALVCYTTLTQALTYDGRGVRKLPVISTGAAIVNIAANYWMIPRFNVQGAAYATLISNSAMALFAAYFATKNNPIPYPWWRIFGLLALAGVGFFVLGWMQAQSVVLAARIGEKLVWLVLVMLVTASILRIRPSELLRLRAAR
jgi:O-antigen/teichoic acid export membrane protein